MFDFIPFVSTAVGLVDTAFVVIVVVVVVVAAAAAAVRHNFE